MMLQAQHHSKIVAEYDEKDKKINVVQELTFFNQTNDTLQSIVLNDWMNAYGDKNSDIGKRFADEFERAFHLAKEKDRGRTENITIITIENSFLIWKRDENSADVIEIQLKEKLSPGEKIKLHLTYSVKIPNARFTKFGFTDDEKVYLKNWFLTPSRYENGSFVKYNNHNIDDIANAVSDYDLEIKLPKNLEVFTDLNKVSETVFTGKNRLDFNLFFGKKNEFESFINQKLEVVTDFRDNRVDDIQRAIVIDKIVNWVDENLGKYPHQKLILTKADYERSPFYGLNQLPAFIAPFPDQFIYEIKFDLQKNTHPLENLIEEIDHRFKVKQQNKIKFAKIFPQGSFPIKSLTESQIKIIENIVKKNGVEITTNDELTDWAIGTQNIGTYLHASKGLKTTMVNVDLGKNLIKRLYESVEFLNI